MARGTSQAGGLTGRTLGHYRLGALLGTGGMAEVYRARDTRLRREVAVKVLPPALAADPSYVTRFRSEARRVAALRHPNIVPVYEFGEQEGLLYLVMPLMQESLRDSLMRSGTLRTGDALAVAIQVASALEAAHAQGIVHRDVKPENILLDRDGRALLTDFGIARELAFLRRQGAVQTLAATGLPVGTPEYMAPEQLRNGPIDQRADVYALGAVLYELLCGVAPHEAGTPYEVAALALTEPITPPALHNPKVWPALETAVMTALSRDPDLRYPNVAAFAWTLREASKRRTGVGGVLRATLPIFRKTAIVDPYEGPTREVLIYGSTGLPTSPAYPATATSAAAARRRLLPTDPGGRRRRPGDRNGNGRGKRKWLATVALLLLALVVAGSGAALLRSGMLDSLLPTRVVFAPTDSPQPTYTLQPTYTPMPTATATPKPTATPQPTATPLPPTATPIPDGTGLAGSYYQGTEPTGTPEYQRVDTTINFPDWESNPPYPDMPNNFSVSWSGRLRATQSGTYTISTLSDDGVRVFINNAVVIDDWSDHGATWDNGPVTLQAGQFYTILVQYYQHWGQATMELYWQNGSNGQQVIIPKSALYPS